VSPGILIITGISILAMLVWVFWPQIGLLALITRFKMNNRKIQIEDALKFLFDCEYKKIPCSLHGVAGNLNISSNKTTLILDHLQSMGLVIFSGDSIVLTDEGRSYALRIIRVHRIWEKYLAEETGISQKEWHGAADLKEHQLSKEATELLAGRIGNPVYDPHGDPIPSVQGEMPLQKGKNLSELKEGNIGYIVHIEDEPGSIYEQLVALGFYPGMQVFVLDVSDGKITFAADGEEHILTSLFASAITVVPDDSQEPITKKHETLASLKLGEKAEIIGISKKCMGQQRRRLLDLGIVPGTIVAAEIKSSSGDPVGYRIKGATIGIRKKQAEQVFINKNSVNNVRSA